MDTRPATGRFEPVHEKGPGHILDSFLDILMLGYVSKKPVHDNWISFQAVEDSLDSLDRFWTGSRT